MLMVGDESERNESRELLYTRRLRKFIFCAMAVSLCPSAAVFAQTPDSQESDSTKSWTATTESKTDSANPTRSFQTHSQVGNRTVDVRSLQTRGPDGNFRPYQDIETETVKVSAVATRTTTRTFVRDSSGTKTLFQVTEEEKQVLPGGDSKVTRTTSNPDANGRLQLVQREDQETRKSSLGAEETRTTVMLPSINGGLAPAMQMQERQKRTGNTVEIQKTTLLPDGTGNWQVGEVRQSTIKDEGKSRSTEERVSRPDSEGRLSEVTRTVGQESAGASGETSKSEQTYSIDLPGVARDDALHLVHRVTTARQITASGQQTIERTEQPNPGDPGAGLRVSTVSTDTARSGPWGTQETQTLQIREGSGTLGIVSVDIKSSDRPIEVQIAPSKPK